MKTDYANYIQTKDDEFLMVCEQEEVQYHEKDFPYQDEMYKIIGACMEVHTVLGPGFLESVYEEALCIELSKRNIPFEQGKILKLYYKDIELKKKFEADLIVYGHIVVELKAVLGPLDPFQGQVINYLSATKNVLALLVNFGNRSLQYRRLIVSRNAKYKRPNPGSL